MKNSKQILNTPVLSISEGKEIGFIKELIVNPDKKNVEFFLVEKNENKKEGAIVGIPFKSAIGIGDYAVTIEHQSNLVDLSQIAFIGDILEKKIDVIDARVVSRKGRLLGIVQEYSLNTETGNIIFIRIRCENDQQDWNIEAEDIISIGQHLVMVSEKVEDEVFSKKLQLKGADNATVQSNARQNIAEKDNTSAQETRHESSASIDLFVEKQKSVLLGKMIKKDFLDNNGQLIAASGTTINAEVFHAAEKIGRQKIIELSMLTE